MNRTTILFIVQKKNSGRENKKKNYKTENTNESGNSTQKEYFKIQIGLKRTMFIWNFIMSLNLRIPTES